MLDLKGFFHVYGNDYLPLKITAPCGLGFVITSRDDENHSGDTVTKNSRTEFLVVNSLL